MVFPGVAMVGSWVSYKALRLKIRRRRWIGIRSNRGNIPAPPMR
jgi:hypothetical protein